VSVRFSETPLTAAASPPARTAASTWAACGGEAVQRGGERLTRGVGGGCLGVGRLVRPDREPRGLDIGGGDTAGPARISFAPCGAVIRVEVRGLRLWPVAAGRCS
jgi:hypothetical protein